MTQKVQNAAKSGKNCTLTLFNVLLFTTCIMAKQAGKYLITGTIDNLCFYAMDGKYYVRMKSSLTRNRVRKSAAFARTMKSANELAAASVMASSVYRTIAKDKRKVLWYRKMTGMAKLLLSKGENKEQIMKKLRKYICFVMMEKTPTIRFTKKIVSYTKPGKNKRRQRFLAASMVTHYQHDEVISREPAPT